MEPEVAARLFELNRRFYTQFGPAFAATRRRIQDGVRRALDILPDEGRWLDVGCGSGALAVEWLRRGRHSAYLGLDFSEPLLEEARAAVAASAASVAASAAADAGRTPTGAERSPASAGKSEASAGKAPAVAGSSPADAKSASADAGNTPPAGFPPIEFRAADLSDPGWTDGLDGPFRGALAFAVFHHLPSHDLRLRVLRSLRDLLVPDGLLVHSQWQFQHSPKLMARRLPWSAAGLREEQLEPGDTLLDWRFALPGQPEQTGLRYVHLFTREELDELAQAAGFEVLETWESDGQGGRLGLYQVWKRGA